MKDFKEIYRLNEGVWALNINYADAAIKEIEYVKKYLYDKFGDDSIFDDLDRAIKKIEAYKTNEEAVKTQCTICGQSDNQGENHDGQGWLCRDCLKMWE